MFKIHSTINGACHALRVSILGSRLLNEEESENVENIVSEFVENVKDVFPADKDLSTVTVAEYESYSVFSNEVIRKLEEIPQLKDALVRFASSITILTLTKEDKGNMIYLRRVFKRIAEKTNNVSEVSFSMSKGLVHHYENNCEDTKDLERLLGV